ncbi:MAG: hypothetical protein HY735_17715 [Verrucomicrobia bacterium]|nr:hypothetical protein [Verrucomicrobiota bacterium]
MRNSRLIGFSLVLFASVISAVLRAADTNAFFPLMAWDWAPPDAASFQKMRECGLTVAGFVSPKELDLCHAAGLKAIVSDPRVSNYDWKNVDETAAHRNVASLVTEVGNHPGVYGFYLLDEPGTELFPGLAKVSALVRELAPGKWAYINLFPRGLNQVPSLFAAISRSAQARPNGVAIYGSAHRLWRRATMARPRPRRAAPTVELSRGKSEAALTVNPCISSCTPDPCRSPRAGDGEADE